MCTYVDAYTQIMRDYKLLMYICMNTTVHAPTYMKQPSEGTRSSNLEAFPKRYSTYRGDIPTPDCCFGACCAVAIWKYLA